MCIFMNILNKAYEYALALGSKCYETFPAVSSTRRHTESSGGWSYTHEQTCVSDSRHRCIHSPTPLETRGYKHPHIHIGQWMQNRNGLEVEVIVLSFCSLFLFVFPLSLQIVALQCIIST